MLAPPGPPVCVGSVVQKESIELSVLGIQTDISHVLVVRKAMYTSVAS